MSAMTSLLIFFIQLTLIFDLEKFRTSSLGAINEYRALHGSPPLQLDEELNETAQLWANVSM